MDPSGTGVGTVSIIPVEGLGEVRAGDDLGTLLTPVLQRAGIRPGDLVCISTKIVSKALGLTVPPQQRDSAVEAASVRLVARRRHTRAVTSVVQIPSGPVMAAAGVDSSNAPDGPLLLPDDPDACAERLRAELTAALGIDLGIVLTDTSSRIWRIGVSDIALGAAGVASLQDLRGSTDDTGRELSVTVRNLADELAAAADLVKGKSDRIPLAIVRGIPGAVTVPGVPARELSRTGDDDWFRRPSLESVWAALGIPMHREPIAGMSPEPDEERIDRALAVASQPRDDHSADPWNGATVQISGPGRIMIRPGGESLQHWAAAGMLVERIRTALAAESIARPLPPVCVDIATGADAAVPDHSPARKEPS